MFSVRYFDIVDITLGYAKIKGKQNLEIMIQK